MGTKLVIDRIDNLLRPLGFHRHKATWNRRSGPFIDVIDLQISKSDDMFTINAGVFDPEIYRQCWSEEPKGIIREPKCTVRARIGELAAGHDLWWDMDGPNKQETFDRIVETIGSSVVPFLERMHSRKAMEGFLTDAGVANKRYPPDIIYLAILMYGRGDRDGACALLHDLRQKTVSGGWRARVGEIAKCLDCS